MATANKNINLGGERKSSRAKSEKRYNLSLPNDLYYELDRIANKHNTTKLEVIRKFIKLGLVAENVESDPNSHLIIKDDKGERELMIML